MDFSTPPHLHAPAPLRQPQPTYDIYGFPNSHEFDFLMIAEGSGGESMGYYGDATGLDDGSEEGQSWGEQRDLFDGFFFGSSGVC